MRSKTSFFSLAIFRKNIERFYLLVLLQLALKCLVLPVGLNTALRYTDAAYKMRDAVQYIYQSTAFTAFIAFCGAAVSAMAVFSYLYTARSANMMASLPVRRESMFLSSAAAVLATVAVSDILAVLFTFAITLPQGMMLGRWLLQWLAIQWGQFLIFFGLAVLSAHLTGSILAMPVIYCVINFVVPALGSVMCTVFSRVMYGVNLELPELCWRLAPLFQLSFRGNVIDYTDYNSFSRGNYELLRYSMTFDLAIYAIAGVLLLAIAFLLYRRRAMESAGDVVAVKVLRPVFRVLFTVCAAFIGGYVLHSIFFDYDRTTGEAARTLSFCTALCGLIGGVLADMLLHKTTKLNLKRAGVPALVLAALCCGSILAARADVTGAVARVPEAAEVEKVFINTQGEVLTLTEPETIGWTTALHHTILDNRERNDYGGNVYYRYVSLDYVLRDGSTLSRRYNCFVPDTGADSAEAEILDVIFNSPGSILQRKATNISITPAHIVSCTVQTLTPNSDGFTYDQVKFTAEEAYELYTTCIYPDMVDGNIGLVNMAGQNKYEFYGNEIEIWLYDVERAADAEARREAYGVPYPPAAAQQYADEYFFTYPTAKSARTNAWLTAHGIELQADGTGKYDYYY